MPGRVLPSSFTAGRPVKLEGVSYQPGDTVPGAVVKRVRALSALLSNGTLWPDKDPSSRRLSLKKQRPTALTAYSVTERQALPE